MSTPIHDTLADERDNKNIPLAETPIYAALKREFDMQERINNLNTIWDGSAIMRGLNAINEAGKTLPRKPILEKGRKP